MAGLWDEIDARVGHLLVPQAPQPAGPNIWDEIDARVGHMLGSGKPGFDPALVRPQITDGPPVAPSQYTAATPPEVMAGVEQRWREATPAAQVASGILQTRGNARDAGLAFDSKKYEFYPFPVPATSEDSVAAKLTPADVLRQEFPGISDEQLRQIQEDQVRTADYYVLAKQILDAPGGQKVYQAALDSVVRPQDRQRFQAILQDVATSTQRPERSFGDKAAARLERGWQGMVDNTSAFLGRTLGLGQPEENDAADFAVGVRGMNAAANPATSNNLLEAGALGAVEMAPPMVFGGAAAAVAPAVGASAAGAGTVFWTTQEQPGLYRELKQAGADDATARNVSIVAGPMIAAIEMIEPDPLIPKALRSGVRDIAVRSANEFLAKLARDAGGTYAKEMGEEIAQAGAGYVAKKVAEYVDSNVKVDNRAELDGFLKQIEEAAISMPFLMGGGVAAGAAQDFGQIPTRPAMTELREMVTGPQQQDPRLEARNFYSDPATAAVWAQANPEQAAALVARGRSSQAAFSDFGLPAMAGSPGDNKSRLQWLSRVRNELTKPTTLNPQVQNAQAAEEAGPAPVDAGPEQVRPVFGQPAPDAGAQEVGQVPPAVQAAGPAPEAGQVQQETLADLLSRMPPNEVETVWRQAGNQGVTPGRTEMIRQLTSTGQSVSPIGQSVSEPPPPEESADDRLLRELMEEQQAASPPILTGRQRPQPAQPPEPPVDPPVEQPEPPKRIGGPIAETPGFTTAKGSTYELHDDGTTTRTKSDHSDVGHDPNDVGTKRRSEKTVFVDTRVAGNLSSAGISGPDGRPLKSRVIVKDGKATLLTWNAQANAWGATESGRDIPVYDKPAAGLSPLELWDRSDDVPGHEAYKGMHAGSEIIGVHDKTSNVSWSPKHPQGSQNVTSSPAPPTTSPPNRIGGKPAPPAAPPPTLSADEQLRRQLNGLRKQQYPDREMPGDTTPSGREADKLPKTVRDSVERWIYNLNDHIRALEQGRKTDQMTGGGGRYEFEVWSNSPTTKAIEETKERIQRFRTAAAKEGVDADKILAELGMPDDAALALSPKAQEWASSDAKRKAERDKPQTESAGKQPAKQPRTFQTAGQAIKAGKSHAEWTDSVYEAFRDYEIDESHPAWKSIQHDVAPPASDWNDARSLYGRHVMTSRHDFGKVTDVADDGKSVEVTHLDGTKSKHGTWGLSDLEQRIKDRTKDGKGVEAENEYMRAVAEPAARPQTEVDDEQPIPLDPKDEERRRIIREVDARVTSVAREAAAAAKQKFKDGYGEYVYDPKSRLSEKEDRAIHIAARDGKAKEVSDDVFTRETIRQYRELAPAEREAMETEVRDFFRRTYVKTGDKYGIANDLHPEDAALHGVKQTPAAPALKTIKPKQQEPAEDEESPEFNPANHIKIAADSIEQLRPQDVYRVLSSGSVLDSNRSAVVRYIQKNRPDLSAQVHDALLEIEEEDRQLAGKLASQQPAAKTDRGLLGDLYRKHGPGISPVAVDKMVPQLADTIDNWTYSDALDPTNKVSRKVFEDVTGIKLPSTIRDTRAIFDSPRPAAAGATEQPAPQPGPAAPVESLPDEQAEKLFDEAQDIMRRLPSDVGKAKREGRLTEGQKKLIERQDEIERILPSTSPQWQAIFGKRRAASDNRIAEWQAKQQKEARDALAKSQFADGQKVKMVSPILGGLYGATVTKGTVKISKNGVIYVAVPGGGQLDLFKNPWEAADAEDSQKDEPAAKPAAESTPIAETQPAPPAEAPAAGQPSQQEVDDLIAKLWNEGEAAETPAPEPPPKKKIGSRPKAAGGITETLSPDLKRQRSREIVQSGEFKTGDRVTWDEGREAGTVEDASGSTYPNNIVVKTDDGVIVRPMAYDVAKEQPKPQKSLQPKKPTKIQEKATDAKSKAKNANSAFLDALRKKMDGSSPTSGLDMDLARLAVSAAKANIEAGIWSFAEFVEGIYQAAPSMIDAAAPYLESAWRYAKSIDKTGKVSEAGKVADVVKQLRDAPKPAAADRDYGTEEKPDRVTLGQYFEEQFTAGRSYERITDARAEVGELVKGKISSNTPQAKDVDEAIEQGVVRSARKIIDAGKSRTDTFDSLVDLYQRQPNLAVRTSTSMAEQAYSTPAPLAYLASQLAEMTPGKTAYDSSAGNGMLLIGTDIDKATANELNPARARALEAMGIETTNKDATQHRPGKRFDAVIINPPFGRVDVDGKPKVWTIDGVSTDAVDHAIVMNTLPTMKDDGRAVLIIGAKGSRAETPLQRASAYSAAKGFFDSVYDNYNVTDHFTVSGELYKRQGAGFPVDVIVIDGKGKSARPRPWNFKAGGIPQVFETWEALKDEKLGAKQSADGVEPQGGGARGGDQAGRTNDDVGDVVAEDGVADPVDVRPAGRRPGRIGTPMGGKGGGGSVGQPKGPGGVRSPSDVPGRDDAATRPEPVDVPDAVPEPTGDGGSDGRTEQPVRLGAAGGGAVKPPAEPASPAATFQVPYEPGSTSKALGTLIPTNHQSAVTRVLERIRDRYGDIDEFVAKEIGATAKQMEGFAAEQVDALALAIASHKEGNGFILGDQTGIGKGRVVAGMIAYANKVGLVPVFVTEKPGLYRDIIRDLTATGFNPNGKKFEFLATNALSGNDVIDLEDVEPNPRIIKQTGPAAKASITAAISGVVAGKGLMHAGKKFDAIFTTYTQMQQQGGVDSWRRTELTRLAPYSFIVLDESHNAGGTEQAGGWRPANTTVRPRSEFIRDLIDASAGVMFSSATYAKRPESLSLYAKAGIGKAVSDITMLGQLIKDGGVRLQQIVSQMLVDAGAYIRRERDFTGVDMASEVLEVDLDTVDVFAKVFANINEFSRLREDAVKDIREDVVSGGGMVGNDNATGTAGVESSNFTSVMHNIIGQMLTALKADAVAERAIAAWNKGSADGESVVVAVDETMESSLDRFVEENGVKIGDKLNYSFRDIARFYLERSREVIIKLDRNDPSTWTRRYIEDSELSDDALIAYNDAMESIEDIDDALPVSPIDWIRHRMTQAGMNVAEVTGRDTIIDYSSGVAVLAKRDQQEVGTAGKIRTVSRFNSGTIDAVVLNRSGSTGLSLHAAKEFKNKKRRHMLIAQPAKNIDEFMQMLGRVHRTGQMTPPKYTLVLTNAPADKRPASILAKKLASLNANVTAAADGQVGFDTPDIMNEVGDQVMFEYLTDNPAIADMMEVSVGSEADPNVAKKATGRSSLLTVEEQQRFWDELEQRYTQRIDELDQADENPLKAKVLDLKARLLSRTTIFEGKQSSNPFEQSANLDLYDTAITVKPPSRAEVLALVSEEIGTGDVWAIPGAADDWSRREQSKLMEAFKTYSKAEEDKGTSVTSTAIQKMRAVSAAMSDYAPGTPVTVDVGTEKLEGVVTSFEWTGKSRNPAVPSGWLITVTVADQRRRIPIPVSRLDAKSPLSATNKRIADAMKVFDEAAVIGSEKRYIATGNILAAMEKLQSVNGKVTFFTNSEGATERGLMLPKSFSPGKWEADQPVVFEASKDVVGFLRTGYPLSTADDVLDLMMVSGTLIVRGPTSKAKNKKYALNQTILDAAGTEFSSGGGRQEMKIADPAKQLATIDAISAVGAIQSTRNKDEARRYLGIDTAAQKATKAADDAAAKPDGRSTFGMAILPKPIARMLGMNDKPRDRSDKLAGDAEKNPGDYADEGIEARAGRSKDPPPKPTRKERLYEIATSVIGIFRPNFFLKNNAANAVANEVLRLSKGVRQRTNDYSIRLISSILDPLGGPRQYKVFSRYALNLNMLANGKKGLRYFYGVENLEDPQGFLEAEVAKLEKVVNATPELKEAWENRQAIKTELVNELVANKILPAHVLDDVDSYLHQYIRFYQEVRRKSGTLEERKPGFAKKRTTRSLAEELDPIDDYLTSELEFFTEAHASLEMKKLRDLFEKEYDRMSEFRRRADRENYVRLVGGEKNAERIEELKEEIASGELTPEGSIRARQELTDLDPTYPYRVRIAMAREDLARKHPDLFGSRKDTDDEYGDPAEKLEFTEEEGVFWAALRHIAADETDDAHIAARTFLKQVAEKKEMIRTTLKDAFVTVQDLVRADPSLKLYTFSPNNIMFPAYTVPERILHEIQAEGMSTVELAADDLKMVMAMGGRKNLMVVPVDVAEQLESMVRTVRPRWFENFQDGVKSLNRVWKWQMLHRPDHLVGFQTNNFFGNMEATFSIPGIGEKLTTAARLASAYYDGQKALPEDVARARDLAVMDSGFFAQEFDNIRELRDFERFFEDVQKLTVTSMAMAPVKWWDGLVQRFGRQHESTFRLAGYLHFKEALDNGTLDYFAGSKPEVIRQLAESMGNDYAAAKLARDTFIDYQNTSILGQVLSDYGFVPFARFEEGAIKRNTRQIKNAVEAGSISKLGIMAPFKTAYLLKRMWLFYAGSVLLNLLRTPDEERDLAAYDKNNPHINLGRDADGRTHVKRNISILGQYLEWFGVNDLGYNLDLFSKGQMTGAQVAMEIPWAAANKIAGGTGPLVKFPLEMFASKTVFPDIRRPRAAMRDEIVAQTIGLNDEYRMMRGVILGDGSTVRPWYWQKFVGIGVSDPRANALGEMHAMRARFENIKLNKSNNEFGGISKYRTLKQAAENEDYEAFRDARRYFITNEANGDAGKAYEGFQKMLRSIDPLANRMSDENEKEFVTNFLQGDDLRKLDVARDYAKTLEFRLWQWWEASSREDDSPAERAATVAAVKKEAEGKRKKLKQSFSATMPKNREQLKEDKDEARRWLGDREPVLKSISKKGKNP